MARWGQAQVIVGALVGIAMSFAWMALGAVWRPSDASREGGVGVRSNCSLLMFIDVC